MNEYSTIAPDEESVVTGKIKLGGHNDGVVYEIDGDFSGGKDQQFSGELDLNRAFRIKGDFSRFQHQLDHDKLDYLNAGVPSGAAAGGYLKNTLGITPTSVYTDPLDTSTKIATYWEVPNFDWLSGDYVTGYIGVDPSTGKMYALNPANPTVKTGNVVAADPSLGNVVWQQLGRASMYGEDFVPNEEFFIDHKEWMTEADLAVFPNVVLHAGARVETRQGVEQAIGMSKCTSCHITGESKDVDEETKDITLGATGKFGMVTLDWEFLNRQFDNKADDATRTYDPALSPNPNTTYSPTNGTFDNRLLYDYEDGELAYDTTPDSEKQSHVLKARVDLPNDASIIGSYVTAKAESVKSSDTGLTLNQTNLSTSYDAYGLKATAKVTKGLTLKARAKVEKIESDAFSYSLTPMNTSSTKSLGGSIDPDSYTDLDRHSAGDGETTTLALDAIYRLGAKTTMRLGYELEKEDRDESDLGDTETATLKASVRSRLAKGLTARASYMMQMIDEPFMNPDAALYEDPTTGLNYFDKDTTDAGYTPGYMIGTGPTYGVDYYDHRSSDMSNLPEDVQELKLASTWAPSANFSATASFRARLEENALKKSSWEQSTYSPSLALWYAANEKLNLTFLYNYLGQSTEAKFCQGWYDG